MRDICFQESIKLVWSDKEFEHVDNNTSLVSLCIPTYNSAEYLRHCLDSIASQTYKNVEVIISDNASMDTTVDIIREYTDRYDFKLFRNAVNIGAGPNFNKLISLAKGEYVAIYHADDFYENTIVEESVRILNSDDTIGLVSTMGNIVSEEGAPFYTFRLPKHLKKMNKTIYTFDEVLSGILKRGWVFVTPSIMVRKKVYDELGVFELQGYGSAVDYAMWFKIANKYKVAIIDEKLINYRVHKAQGTEREVRKNPEVPDIVLVLRKYKELTTNKHLKRQCEDFINAMIIKAARRQNYYGLYSKSNETLKTMRSGSVILLLQKYVFRLFNVLKISIRRRSLSTDAE